jgi:hypothetical protein
MILVRDIRHVTGLASKRLCEVQVCSCEDFFLSGFVGDFEFFHGYAVAPEAHEALLGGVAEGVFAVLAGEGGVA